MSAGSSQHREKVVVAMSGGVDSSVTACLLQEQGYDVVGLFMRVGAHHQDVPDEACKPNGGAASDDEAAAEEGVVPARTHQGCCSASDAADARYVAGMLGVPFYALNFKPEFERIIDYFAEEYVNGRTPNPCVVCNNDLKFGRLLDYADTVGAKYIATGHYARIEERDGRRVLCRGLDEGKDQSYVLFGIEQTVLDRVMFPIGHLPKREVRDLASRFDLRNQNKPDSVEICFVPDRDYASVVRERRPEAFVEGDVLSPQGEVLGRHQGIPQFTIGQRRGLGIAAGKPVYVTQLNVESNTVVLGEQDDLLADGLLAGKVNWLAAPPEFGVTFAAQVKIRYQHRAAPARVTLLADGRIRVVFEQAQRAVTPGQAAVVYDGDVVVGGGWIEAALKGAGPVAAQET